MEGFRDYYKEKNGVQSYDEIEAAIEFFVEQEREACAKIADRYDTHDNHPCRSQAYEIAEAIRERK